LEEFFKSTRVSLDQPDTVEKLKKQLRHACYSVEQVIPDLRKFCRTEPRLPDDHNKTYNNALPITLKDVSSAQDALEKISALRESNECCDLAFSVFRDMSRSPWKPFLKAALERNPVSVNETKDLSIDKAYSLLIGLPGESIYGEPSRIAQPDEVWNYQRGDGLEKAVTLADIIRSRDPGARFIIESSGIRVALIQKEGRSYDFTSEKSVTLPEEKDFIF
jgi:hypothetical protein